MITNISGKKIFRNNVGKSLEKASKYSVTSTIYTLSHSPPKIKNKKKNLIQVTSFVVITLLACDDEHYLLRKEIVSFSRRVHLACPPIAGTFHVEVSRRGRGTRPPRRPISFFVGARIGQRMHRIAADVK